MNKNLSSAPAPGTEAVQVFLPKGALVKSRGGFALRVLKGRLWITRSGHLDDHFVSGGQSFDLPAGSSALIEADRDAQVLLGPLGKQDRPAPAAQPALTIGPRCWRLA